MGNRTEHINLLESSLLNNTRGVSEDEVELISKVIDVSLPKSIAGDLSDKLKSFSLENSGDIFFKILI